MEDDRRRQAASAADGGVLSIAGFGCQSQWNMWHKPSASALHKHLPAAARPRSRRRCRVLIAVSLDATKTALGVRLDCDWTEPYYQFCNRLAASHVMNTAGTLARLLFVYFCGDCGGGGRDCPVSELEWQPTLVAMEGSVGLPAAHSLSDRVHKVFVDVPCRD